MQIYPIKHIYTFTFVFKFIKFISILQVQIQLPTTANGQTISYLPELPSIRYFPKVSNPVGQCELAESIIDQAPQINIINPKNLTSRNNNNRQRWKREAVKVHISYVCMIFYQCGINPPTISKNLYYTQKSIFSKTRQRRQEYAPEYSENAGVEYRSSAYDYDYDPTLKLNTNNSNGNEVNTGQSRMSEEPSDGIVVPMTKEERILLEQYR